MQGYQQNEALEYIKAHFPYKNHKELRQGEVESLLQLAQEADLNYMRQSGVLAEDGLSGDAFYDDDDAFEFIDEQLCKLTGANEEKAMRIAAVIDDYMDLQQSYLDEHGLMDWD